MERKAVESSNLAEIGYDENDRILEVKFKKGVIYRYYEVPSTTYAEIVEAESVGRVFQELVKAGGYRYERLESE
jgi:hypothetical protein